MPDDKKNKKKSETLNSDFHSAISVIACKTWLKQSVHFFDVVLTDHLICTELTGKHGVVL